MTTTFAWMRWDFFIGRGGDYGDLVVWVGPLYLSFVWKPPPQVSAQDKPSPGAANTGAGG